MALLSAQEQQILLTFVRQVLVAQAEGRALPEIPPLAILEQRGSCFVTLFENGSVRGCIGGVDAVEPLGKSLIRHAVNAGFNDPMFPPLAAAELGDVSVEITLVREVRPIASPEEFQAGRDGIILRWHGRRGVLLPLITLLKKWNREETLAALAAKIGATENAWSESGAELAVFSVEHFGEKRLEAAEF